MRCPSCGSLRVYPSRPRNVVERLRQTLSDKQPIRCHECDWRQWRAMSMTETQAPVVPDDLRTGRRPSPVSTHELERLDSVQRP